MTALKTGTKTADGYEVAYVDHGEQEAPLEIPLDRYLPWLTDRMERASRKIAPCHPMQLHIYGHLDATPKIVALDPRTATDAEGRSWLDLVTDSHPPLSFVFARTRHFRHRRGWAKGLADVNWSPSRRKGWQVVQMTDGTTASLLSLGGQIEEATEERELSFPESVRFAWEAAGIAQHRTGREIPRGWAHRCIQNAEGYLDRDHRDQVHLYRYPATEPLVVPFDVSTKLDAKGRSMTQVVTDEDPDLALLCPWTFRHGWTAHAIGSPRASFVEAV